MQNPIKYFIGMYNYLKYVKCLFKFITQVSGILDKILAKYFWIPKIKYKNKILDSDWSNVAFCGKILKIQFSFLITLDDGLK